jgi:phosphoribosylanthranilate isomerase
MNSLKMEKPWFLAGGIGLDNIEEAMAFNPYALDISSGAETDGIKDREKIVQLVPLVRREKEGKHEQRKIRRLRRAVHSRNIDERTHQS